MTGTPLPLAPLPTWPKNEFEQHLYNSLCGRNHCIQANSRRASKRNLLPWCPTNSELSFPFQKKVPPWCLGRFGPNEEIRPTCNSIAAHPRTAKRVFQATGSLGRPTRVGQKQHPRPTASWLYQHGHTGCSWEKPKAPRNQVWNNLLIFGNASRRGRVLWLGPSL